MPNIRFKSNGHRLVDPGGDAATTGGGVAESNGAMVTTSVVGWRQLLIDRGGAESVA